MNGADIWLGWATGATTGQMYDYWADGLTAPSLDAVQDLTIVAYSQASGVTTLEFKRKWNTGNSVGVQDNNLDPYGANSLIWAIDTADPSSSSLSVSNRHSAKGSYSLNLCPGCTAPDAPSLMLGSKSSSWISLNWAAPSPNGAAISGYTLQSDGGSGGVTFTTIYTGTALTFNATGLTGGMTYQFRVSATNGVGTSSYSTVLSVQTLGGVPTAPQPPVVTASSTTSITVQWAAPNSNGGLITSYQLRRDGTTILYTGANTQFTITSLTASQSLTLEISASNSFGQGPWSTPASYRSDSNSASVPNPPTGLTSTATTSSSISLSWAAPVSDGGSMIQKYTVEGKKAVDTSFVTYNDSTTTSITILGLQAETAYIFRVYAINSKGSSITSSQLSVTTAVAVVVPGKPKSLVASSIRDRSLTLAWTAPDFDGNAAITAYKVLRKNSSAESSANVVYSGSSLTFTDNGLVVGSKPVYQVQAINSAGAGALSDAVTVELLAPLSPTFSSSDYASNYTAGSGSTVSFYWKILNANSTEASIEIAMVWLELAGLQSGSNLKEKWQELTSFVALFRMVLQLCRILGPVEKLRRNWMQVKTFCSLLDRRPTA